jgi:hypothetical protein
MGYRVRKNFSARVGFNVNASDVLHAATVTNGVLSALPASLYRSLDFKTSSAILGAVFCEHLADRTRAMVNPIEKGHPDIVPRAAAGATEAQLRNYPSGLEVKSTIGNIVQGANLRAGVKRVAQITGITWQAHHRDVRELMGLAWDFVQERESFHYPGITGVFYSSGLVAEDWGTISGTTGRNTKVSGMRSSGKNKMGQGWVLVWDDDTYVEVFERVLGVVC